MLYEVFGVDFEVEHSSPATNHDLNQQVTVIMDGMNRSILKFHATVPPLFDLSSLKILMRRIDGSCGASLRSTSWILKTRSIPII
jgi:hypothetical protein